MRRTLWAAIALLIGACDEPEPSVPVQNQCIDQESCSNLRESGGATPRCNESIGTCVLLKTEEPYQLFLRVKATTEGTMLADAGITLVPETVTSLGTLEEGRDAEVVRIKRAISVPGSVSVTDPDSGKLALVESEVVIRARDAMVPLSSSVYQTRNDTPPPDGGPSQLRAVLDPDGDYDMQVQPLLGDAHRLPPVRQDFDLTKPISVLYDDALVEARTGKLIFREEAPLADAGVEQRPEPSHPLQVRLQDKLTGDVLSSSTLVEVAEDGRSGTFTLYAPRAVFASRSFNLVIGLADFPAWQVTINIDGARFLSGPEIFLPRIPRTVTRTGRVEDDDSTPLPLVDIEFVSHYPADAGSSSTPAAGGTDWCLWQDPARLGCLGHFQTTSDPSGGYEIELLPGDYDVMILPRPEESSAAGLVASTAPLSVTAEGIGGDTLVAEPGSPYTGTISAGDFAAPDVTLRAIRRPTPPFSSWGPVANFNRTTKTVSDRKGHVTLLPDVGYYDFVVEPPDNSGFAWKLWLDCPNGPEGGGALRALTLSAPVMVTGVVEYEDSGVPLQASIEAFTTVAKRATGPTRSVMIGRAQTDERGVFHLALPPRVGEGDRQKPCESSAVTDNAR